MRYFSGTRWNSWRVVDLPGQLLDGVGAEEIAVVGGEGMADVPPVALDRALSKIAHSGPE